MSSKDKSKQLLQLLIIFTVLTSLYLWDGFLQGNEAQTIANVYHFTHPEWLENDWFLSLDTIYRLPFNLLFYVPAKMFSITVFALIARLALLSAFSIVLWRFLSHFNITNTAIIIWLIITFRMKGMMAGEDMLWHAETKVVSYIFIIAALDFLLSRKYALMYLSFGLSATFHPLVGGYAIITFFSYAVMFRRSEIRALIRKSWFLLLSIWPALIIIIVNLLQSSGAGELSDLLYVARHPHHLVFPKFFRHVHKGIPEWLDYIILYGNIIFCYIVLFLTVVYTSKGRKIHTLTEYALLSTIFIVAGIIFYYSHNYPLLKYYLFRFPDVIVPFVSYLGFIIFLDRTIIRKQRKLQKFGCIVLLTGALFYLGIQSNEIIEEIPYPEFVNTEDSMKEMCIWIRENTDADHGFIIPPRIDNFHVTARRAQYVTFKHIPQSEVSVIAWYDRLKRLNGNKALFDGNLFFNLKDIKSNYQNLSDEELLLIAEQKDIKFYIGRPDRKGDLETVYQNVNYAIYQIKE